MGNLSSEFFDELISDTSFVKADVGSLMSSSKRITTPILVLNCLFGGLPFSTISEISGPPQSGKSTFSYQTMGNYQKEYPNGISVILDMESSMDNDRLRSLGIDTNKILRLPATTIENAFANLFVLIGKLEKKLSEYPDLTMMCMYDTISAGGTNKQQDSASAGGGVMNAGGMMEAPRVIKNNLANLFTHLEKLPVYLGLLNQISIQGVGSYHPTTGSGGGWGLKHNCHMHIQFGSPTDLYDGPFITGTHSTISMKKSKLSPKFNNIPCIIDVRKGGVVDVEASFLEYLTYGGVDIVKAASWYSAKNTMDYMIEKYPSLKENPKIAEYSKNYRKNDMYNLIRTDRDFLDVLQIRFIDFINDMYPSQASINQNYRNKIMDRCQMFKDVPRIDYSTGEVIESENNLSNGEESQE